MSYGQLALNSELAVTCATALHMQRLRPLLVATPADWHVRLPGKLAGSHYQRIKSCMTKARALRMCIVLVGPP
eukprot:5030475-Pyramimonas_sp.AAC.1